MECYQQLLRNLILKAFGDNVKFFHEKAVQWRREGCFVIAAALWLK